MRLPLASAALLAVVAAVAGGAGAQNGKPPTVGAIVATFSLPTTTYVVSASDPDGGELTFAWTKTGSDCGTFTQSKGTARWSHPDAVIGGDCPTEPVHPSAIVVVVSDGSYECRVEYPDGSGVGQGPAPAPCRELAASTVTDTTTAEEPVETTAVPVATPATEADSAFPLALVGGIGAVGLAAAGAVVLLVRRRRSRPGEGSPAPAVFAGDCDAAWQEGVQRLGDGRRGLHDPLLQTSATLVGGVVSALEALSSARRSLERLRLEIVARRSTAGELDVEVVPVGDPVVRLVLHGNEALDALVRTRVETSAKRAEARSPRLGLDAPSMAEIPSIGAALAAAYHGLPSTRVPRGAGAGMLEPVAAALPAGGAFMAPVRLFNEPDVVLLGALLASDGDGSRLAATLGPERAACLAGSERLADWLPALSAIDQAGPDDGDGQLFEEWGDLEGGLDRSPVTDVHGLSGRAAVRAVTEVLWRDLTPPAEAPVAASGVGAVSDTLAETPEHLRDTAKGMRDKALGEVRERAAENAARELDALAAVVAGCSRCGPEWTEQRSRRLDELRGDATTSIGVVQDVASHAALAAKGLDLLADALEHVAALGDAARTARAIAAAQGLLLLELSSFQHTFLPAGAPPFAGAGPPAADEQIDEGG